MPSYFVWHNDVKEWKERKHSCQNMMTEHDKLGRLVFVHLRQKERYCLRLLLRHVPNPISYKDLRTYNHKIYDTCQEACAAHGLLDDDTQWHNTLEEAISYFSPSSVRDMFAFILAYSEPSEPHKL